MQTGSNYMGFLHVMNKVFVFDMINTKFVYFSYKNEDYHSLI